MEVHQLVHTLSYGDAISGEVIAIQRHFQKQQLKSEIYAINVHSHYKTIAKDYRSFPQFFSGQVVLHYSLGSPLNDLYMSLGSAKRLLIYHNLTPPHWFSGVNPRIVADIKHGLEELPLLCKASHSLMADSAFNATDKVVNLKTI